MKRVMAAVATVILLLACLLTIASGNVESKRASRPEFGSPVADVPAISEKTAVRSVSMDSIPVALFDFDGESGPDPQGWTAVDLTEEPNAGLYWHADDFASENDYQYQPLSGSQSLWCGVNRDEYISPMYSSGYCNNWEQYFQSRPFSVAGDVSLSFELVTDMGIDAGYDYFSVEHSTQTGAWNTLLERSTGWSRESVNLTIPAAQHGSSLVIRMTFLSDAGYSDEDGLNDTHGAVIVDDLEVSDAEGTVDFENFEDEAPGALTTTDGDWSAVAPRVYGDHAALVDGHDVHQENISPRNDSALWCFYSGSTANYSCGGHPEQIAVPWPLVYHTDDIADCLTNEIRSPWVNLLQDPAGNETAILPDSLVFVFRVYRDLPLANLVLYSYRYRHGDTSEAGEIVEGSWMGPGFNYYSSAKDWYERKVKIRLNWVTDWLQVGLQAKDMSWYYWRSYGWPSCHSHAPLYDDVSIIALKTIDWVEMTGPATTTAVYNQALPPILGRARIDGLTESAGPTSGLTAYLGVGEPDSDPRNLDLTWTWHPASFLGDENGCDVFSASPTTYGIGRFAYAYRFTYSDSPPYVAGKGAFADLDGSDSGFDQEQLGILTSVYFAEIAAGFSGVAGASVVWGDYDSDGDLDAALTGGNSDVGSPFSKIYRNDGGGVFVDAVAGLTGVTAGEAAWGDYDNDGDLDLVVSGSSPTTPSGVTNLYRNDGINQFTQIASGLPGLLGGTLAWGDFDADGDLDLVIAGFAPTDGIITNIYRNDGNSGFADIEAGLPGFISGAARWGDLDGDGDLDLLLSGSGATHLFRQDSEGSFIEVPTDIAGASEASCALSDYDNDSDLDLAISGRGESPSQTDFIRIYRNDGGFAFVDAGFAGSGAVDGNIAWGDFDNDGRLDLLQTGSYTTRIYHNSGSGGFRDIQAEIIQLDSSDAAWGDFDGDGDLDILASGDSPTSGHIARLYRNDGPPPNAPPSTPSPLTATMQNGVLVFTWTSAADDHTPGAGLTYNLRVGATPGGSEILSSMAAATDGRRFLSAPGNVGHATSFSITPPPSWDTIYWAVQAVDGAYAGSLFSAEQAIANATSSPNAEIPNTFGLRRAFPNPFNPQLNLEYDLPRDSTVKIAIYDLQGREVAVLHEGGAIAGRHVVSWNGRNGSGERVPSGNYVCRIESGRSTATTTITLVK